MDIFYVFLPKVTFQNDAGSTFIDDVDFYGRDLTCDLDLKVDSSVDVKAVICSLSYTDF